MTFKTPLFTFLLLSLLSLSPAQKSYGGYRTKTDVEQHALIDLDQQKLEEYTDAGKWAEASAIYKNGENSQKTGSKRTIQDFSASAGEKMKDEPYFKLFKAYYGEDSYGDTFVTDALEGLNDFKGEAIKFRGECANKGAQYQNIWMYVVHELEDAVDDCFDDEIKDNDDRDVTAWDEAWAFYTGSIINSDGTNVLDGKLMYTLAHTRASNAKLIPNGDDIDRAPVNKKLIELFTTGQRQLDDRECKKLLETKNEIVKYMQVPLLQGLVRYIVKVKVEVESDGLELEKGHGEGWAFASALLPLLDHCDKDIATKIVKNFKPSVAPMSDSIEDVMKSLMSAYGCLGVSCGDMGTQFPEIEPKCDDGGSFKAVSGTNKSASGKGGGGLSGGAIVGIIIGVLLVLVIIAFLVLRSKRSKGSGLPTAAGMNSAPTADDPFTA